MPIKVDSGPIYPFVSMAFQGDTVRIVEFAAINNWSRAKSRHSFYTLIKQGNFYKSKAFHSYKTNKI